MIPGAIRPVIDLLMQVRLWTRQLCLKRPFGLSRVTSSLRRLVQKFAKGQDATMRIIDVLVPASDADKFGRLKESASSLQAILALAKAKAQAAASQGAYARLA